MTYNELLTKYKNNEFRAIDAQENAHKFYLLRTLSKSSTLKKFKAEMGLTAQDTLDDILDNPSIGVKEILEFITSQFQYKSDERIGEIVAELNKMQNFDWGGSYGNSLEQNIVNHYIKKIQNHGQITGALSGGIQAATEGYTMNSWYNYWSSVLIEELFNQNPAVTPTLDLVKGIDFFINEIPYDLKVTYFPEELMKQDIALHLERQYHAKTEHTAMKKICKALGIPVPTELKEKALSTYLYQVLRQSAAPQAVNYVQFINETKREIVQKYVDAPDEIIRWMYENQGGMRFDAANRLFLILVDASDMSQSWKLKRDLSLLQSKINGKINDMVDGQPKEVTFHWKGQNKTYSVKADVLFVVKE